MTILNNNNNRKQSTTTKHKTTTIFSSKLNLVCLALVIMITKTSTSAVNDEEQRNVRHHHDNNNEDPEGDDVYVEELHNAEKPLNAYDSQPACPNCLYASKDDEDEPIIVTSRASRRRNNDNLRLEAIKRQILTKLGLRHKPNVTKAAMMMPRKVVIETLFRAEDSAPSVPIGGGSRERSGAYGGSTGYSDGYVDSESEDSSSAGRAAYETEEVSDDFYGRTSEIISFPAQGYKVNGNRLLEFRVSPEAGQLGQEFRIRAATLWLKADIRYTRAQHCRTTEIYVFKFKVALQDNVKINSREFSRLTDYPVALHLNETQPGWQKIDVTSIVRDWLTESPQDKLRLFIDCSCCSSMWNIHLLNNNNYYYKGGRYFSGEGGSRGAADGAENKPFLVIHTDPTQIKRVRRRALDCGADSGNQCCKQRFYVSFRELGWEDWIIAPQGYYANYCRGDCSHSNPLMGGVGGGHHHHHRTPDTYANYHTHVIEEIRKTHHLSGMQPCCAPLKFSSVSLIYFGPDSNIIKRDLPKMVVDECGCP